MVDESGLNAVGGLVVKPILKMPKTTNFPGLSRPNQHSALLQASLEPIWKSCEGGMRLTARSICINGADIGFTAFSSDC